MQTQEGGAKHNNSGDSDTDKTSKQDKTTQTDSTNRHDYSDPTTTATQLSQQLNSHSGSRTTTAQRLQHDHSTNSQTTHVYHPATARTPSETNSRTI
jgi:hypothetical protein